MIFVKELTVKTLPNHDAKTLRRLPYDELFTYISGWKEGSKNHIKGRAELERRQNIWSAYRSWLSIIISILSVVVAIAAYFNSQLPPQP